MDAFSLKDRTVLVTGASSGIGRAVAVAVSQLGGRVMAWGRDQARLGETLGMLEGTGHAAHSVDMSDAGVIEPAIAETCSESGPLGGLVHCAGVSQPSLLRDADFSKVDAMSRLNWLSFLALCRAVCRRGRYAPQMSVVAVASMAALRGQAAMSAYAGSKGAVLASVPALAAEYAPRGIRFNSVSPCPVDTPMQRAMIDKLGSDWYRREVEEKAKLGPLAPEDVANAIVFLLSPAARRITGVNLVVDSGWSLG
ncbi:MAG: SDR family oxidoreductase [Synergistaceae bacterium]|jgi:NAD(P)-dependent dehydrogenase (short-subunit alcohol dehydrogenase family)|nr:SDR family oxidoreductase [Synergistaceae bacterium]